MTPPLEEIVSGGQSGADRAALDIALRFDIPHSGWCPAGRRAEDGPLSTRYRLKETPSRDYAQRTRWNVRDSDGTVVFTFDPEATGGSKLTLDYAGNIGKPHLHIFRGLYQAELDLYRFVVNCKIRRLNIAGSRESTNPGIYRWVMHILENSIFWSEQHPNVLGGPGDG